MMAKKDCRQEFFPMTDDRDVQVHLLPELAAPRTPAGRGRSGH